MEYSFGAAIIAGLVAGAAMAILLYMGIAMMPGQRGTKVVGYNLFLTPRASVTGPG